MGMAKVLDRKPDLVLSGINAGMNVADDVLYSGTIAAAMEASLMGVPAMRCRSATVAPRATSLLPLPNMANV